MPEVSRVARFIFHVTLGKFLIFLSYPMLCLPRVARPPFSVMLWQRRGNYPPFIVIARLGKAEYRLRQIPSSSLQTDKVGVVAAFRHTPSPLRGEGGGGLGRPHTPNCHAELVSASHTFHEQ